MNMCTIPDCKRPAKGKAGKFCVQCAAARRSAGRKLKYAWTPAMDDQIRSAYRLHLTSPGHKRVSIKGVLGARFGRPDYIIQQRASKLGLCRPKEKRWTEAEVELLALHSWKSEPRISEIFRRNGFHRSANAIHVMRVRQLGVRRRDYPFYSANSLAKLMGIDRHGVMLWIKRGLLEAKRRGTERSANQGGDEWLIRPSHIRRFLIENPVLFDIRKVEQLWFMDLLTNRGANSQYVPPAREKPEEIAA